MRRIINQNPEGNLLETTPEVMNRFSHLLRDEDFEGVKEAIIYLSKNGLSSYLAGSVVNNWLFNGIRAYKDVDLIATPYQERGREDGRIPVARSLTDFAKKKIGVRLGENVYNVSQETNVAYIGDTIDCRFILTPGKYISPNDPDAKLIEPAKIDLCLVSRKRFEESLKKRK